MIELVFDTGMKYAQRIFAEYISQSMSTKSAKCHCKGTRKCAGNGKSFMHTFKLWWRKTSPCNELFMQAKMQCIFQMILSILR